MNKKGFLLGEMTVKIIIAVISILLLIAVLGFVYLMFAEKAEKEKATASLEKIKEGILSAKNSENGKFEEVLLSPEGWGLFYYENNVPKNCPATKCLCLCPDEEIEKCEKEGVCESVDEKIKVNDVNIENGIDILIEDKGGEVSITEIN